MRTGDQPTGRFLPISGQKVIPEPGAPTPLTTSHTTGSDSRVSRAWQQHHKFNMILLTAMILVPLPSMWVAHDGYYFFSSPGLDSWVARAIIDVALTYLWVGYHLPFVVRYVLFAGKSGDPASPWSADTAVGVARRLCQR